MNELGDALSHRLVDSGWSDISGATEPTFTQPVNRDGGPSQAQYLMHLNLSGGPWDRYYTYYGPALGVWVPEHSRLLSGFLGVPDTPGSVVSTTLADRLVAAGISQPYTRWSALSGNDADAAAATVVEDIATYGIPYLSNYTTYRTMIDKLRASNRTTWGDLGNLALLEILNDERSAALQTLARYRTVANAQPSLVAEQALRFLQAFQSHFEIEDRELELAE